MGNNYYYLLTNLLTEDERRVITSIVQHIENGARKVGIQQIADENYVSPAFIMKLCKRLGFDGYSELFYYLVLQNSSPGPDSQSESLHQLIDNYSEESVKLFCEFLTRFREQKLFVVGEGFADLVAAYLTQRLAVCGFMVFNRVHFYDLMLVREDLRGDMVSNIAPSMIIAISQSGETESVVNDVKRAREKGFKVAAFSRREESTLADLSDVLFIVNAAKQTLISEIPNSFFGKVILAFEELLGVYFR
jgi:DNA-binding MurR/RpiR family transcriptional regulator